MSGLLVGRFRLSGVLVGRCLLINWLMCPCWLLWHSIITLALALALDSGSGIRELALLLVCEWGHSIELRTASLSFSHQPASVKIRESIISHLLFHISAQLLHHMRANSLHELITQDFVLFSKFLSDLLEKIDPLCLRLDLILLQFDCHFQVCNFGLGLTYF